VPSPETPPVTTRACSSRSSGRSNDEPLSLSRRPVPSCVVCDLFRVIKPVMLLSCWSLWTWEWYRFFVMVLSLQLA
jgi:hypothetical protein